MELKRRRQSLVKHLGELLELEKKKESFGKMIVKRLDVQGPFTKDNKGKINFQS